jgi:hypothetical protein
MRYLLVSSSSPIHSLSTSEHLQALKNCSLYSKKIQQRMNHIAKRYLRNIHYRTAGIPAQTEDWHHTKSSVDQSRGNCTLLLVCRCSQMCSAYSQERTIGNSVKSCQWESCSLCSWLPMRCRGHTLEKLTRSNRWHTVGRLDQIKDWYRKQCIQGLCRNRGHIPLSCLGSIPARRCRSALRYFLSSGSLCS